MTAFVLDNSVAMRWLFEDGSAHDLAYAVQVLNTIGRPEASAFTPALWPFELVSVTARGVRQAAVTDVAVAEFFDIVNDLGIAVQPVDASVVMGPVFQLATRHRISAYDASYLELALRLQVPLATLDKDLRKALAAEGGTLFAADAAS